MEKLKFALALLLGWISLSLFVLGFIVRYLVSELQTFLLNTAVIMYKGGQYAHKASIDLNLGVYDLFCLAGMLIGFPLARYYWLEIKEQAKLQRTAMKG